MDDENDIDFEDEAGFFFTDTDGGSTAFEDDDEDLFGEEVDAVSLLENLNEGGDSASVQTFTVLSERRRQAQQRRQDDGVAPGADAAPESGGTEQGGGGEDRPKQRKRGARANSSREAALFGAGVDDLLQNEEIQERLGLTRSRKAHQRKRRYRLRRQALKKKGRKVKHRKIPEEISEKLGQANFLFSQGRFQDVVQLLHVVLREMPNMAEPYQLLGEVYEELEMPRKALNAYMFACFLDKRDIRRWKHCCTLSTNMGMYEQAVGCLNHVIRHDRGDMDARWDRAVLYAELGQLYQAVKEVEKLAIVRPGDGEVPKMLARLYHRRGDPRRAVQVMEQFLANFPERVDPTHLNILSELYMLQGSFQRALELLRSQLEAAGAVEMPVDLLAKMSVCHARLGDDEQALQGLQFLLQNEASSFPDLLHDAAATFLHVGKPQHALPFLRKLAEAVDVLACNAEWLHTAIDGFHKQGLAGQASALCAAVAAVLSPSDAAFAQVALAEVKALLLEGREDEAASACRRLGRQLAAGEVVPPEALASRLAGEMCQLQLQLGLHQELLAQMYPQVHAAMASFARQQAVIETALAAIPDTALRQRVRGRISLRQVLSQQRQEKDRAAGGITTDDEGGATSDGGVPGQRGLMGNVKALKQKDRRKKHIQDLDAMVDDVLRRWQSETDRPEQQLQAQPPAAGETAGGDGAQQGIAPIPSMLTNADEFGVLFTVCRLLLHVGRLDEAEALVSCVEKGLAGGSKVLSRRRRDCTRILRTHLCTARGRMAQSVSHLKALLNQWPYSVEVANEYCATHGRMGGLPRQSLRALQQLRLRHPASLPLMLLQGHCHLLAGQYTEALGEYLHAFRLAPQEPLVLLCVAVASLHMSLSRQCSARHFTVLQAFSFLQSYAEARDSRGESSFNLARAAHQLGLNTIAAQFYEQSLRLRAPRPPQPSPASCPGPIQDEQGVGVSREAAHNLALIYRQSGAPDLARNVLKRYLVV